MHPTYEILLSKAKQHSKQLKKWYKQLQNKKSKNVDEVFAVEHDKAFKNINCLLCANCCKTTSPIFRHSDIKPIAKYLGLSEINFIDLYLKIDTEGDYVLKSSPCAFLDKNNFCSIYELRPKACREYPHTNRKNMVDIALLTYKNSQICPAVAQITFEVIKKLK